MVIDLLFTEILVDLRIPGGQHQVTELDAGAVARGFDTGAVEVVAVGDAPDQTDAFWAVRQGIEPECLIRWQEVRLGLIAAEGSLDAACRFGLACAQRGGDSRLRDPAQRYPG